MSTSTDSITAESIETRLTELVAEETDVDPSEIDTDKSLTQYGLDSMNAIILTGELEDWLGIEVPSTVAWDYPTISELSRFLMERAEEELETIS